MPDFTIFRVTDGVVAADDVVSPERLAGLEKHGPLTMPEFTANLYVDRPYRQRPPWVQFLEDGFPNSIDWRPSQGLGALLVVETRRRQQILNFALAFGPSGRNLIRDGAFRRRWGLRAALNFLTDPSNPPRLRAFDTVRHGPSVLRSRVQSTSLADLGTFELDVFRDLIRNAVGQPADNAFGVRVGGADALQISREIAFDRLGEFCMMVDNVANQTVYRQRFAFVDYVQSVNDPGLEQSLEAEVLAHLKSPTPEQHLLLALPEVVEWETLAQFQFHYDTRHRPRLTRPDVTLGDYLAGLRPDQVAATTVENLRSRRIHGLTADGDAYRDWSVWKCLVGEFEFEGRTYILEDGSFFGVDPGFLNSLNQDVMRFAADDAILPSARVNEWERRYNERAANSSPDLLLLDRNLIRVPGTGDVELCDLVSANRQLIHVKSYSGSGTLSHLFSQARTSTDLLQVNDEFRDLAHRKLRTLAGTDRRFDFLQAPIRTNDFEIIFAVMRRWAGKTVEALPFFAKLNLKAVTSELFGRGFKVKVARIDRQ